MNKKINKIFSLFLSFGLLLESYSNAYALSNYWQMQQDVVPQAVVKTYIVDKDNVGGKNCNDAWAGTLAQPLCSIGKGLTLLQPGDTLLVRKGTYPSFSVTKSGTAGKYITISGYGNEMPLVNGGQGIELKGTSYVALKGFEVTAATGNWAGGITVTNSSTANPLYNIIEGNKVHHNIFPNMSGIKISEGSYNKILHNEVYNNYFDGIRVTGVSSVITENEIGYNTVYNHTLAGSDSDGIGLYGPTVTKTYIHDNIVHDNSDDGIDTWDSAYNIIVNNISYNHVGVGDGNGFKMGGTTGGHNIVKNNISYNNKARGFDSNGSGGNVYYQNVAYNNTGFGFQDAWRRDTSCTANSCPGVFINNIGYNNVKGNFSAGPYTLTSHNNIWYSDSGSPKVSYNATVYSSLSAFYAASGNRLDNPNAGDLSTLQVNPQFLNPAGFQFDLLPSSPAIDSGDPANPGQVTAIKRVDIGVFEYGSNSVFVADIVRANSNPTNAASVDFTVTFSQAATGVDITDFTLTTTGVSGATVNGVSGSGSVYTVTVATGSGDGTIRLDVVDDDTIIDDLGNTLAGPGDGSFATGEYYTILKYMTPVDFGSQLFRTFNPSRTITISNVHGIDIHLGGLQASESVGSIWNPAQSFFIENDTCSGAALSPNGTCTFDVKFLPWSLGVKSGVITVPSDAPDQPYMAFLKGDSVAGTQLLSNRSFDNYAVSTRIPDVWSGNSGINIGSDGVDGSWAFHGPMSFKFVGNGILKVISQVVNKTGAPGDDFSFNIVTHGVNIPKNADRWLLQVMFYNGNTMVENRNIPLMAGTYQESRLTRTYTATTNYTQIVFRIHFGKGSGSASIDLASLVWAP